MGGEHAFSGDNWLNHFLLFFATSIAICSVNVFVIISGYFLSCSSKFDLLKPIKLIIQVILFNLVFFIISIAVGSNEFYIRRLLACFVPVNWFVILYFALYVCAPYINRLVKNLTIKEFKVMLIKGFLVFSVWDCLSDVYVEIAKHSIMGLSSVNAWGNSWGYTIVQFVLMYLIGAYFRFSKFKMDTRKLVSIILLLAFIITGWAYFDKMRNFGGYSAWAYSNPLVIAESAAVFLLFNNIDTLGNKCINKFSKACFTAYLINIPLLKFFSIQSFANSNPFIMLGHLLYTCSAIYLIAYFVYVVYSLMMVPVFNRIDNYEINIGIDDNK